jgi:phenylacetate-CoA ligase
MMNEILYKIIIKKGLRSDSLIPNIFFKYTFLRKIIIDVDTYALMKSQYWSREKIKELQLERIKSLLIHANKNIPFWKERLDLEEMMGKNSINWNIFFKIPILKKKKNNFKGKQLEDFTDKNLFGMGYFSSKTSGSTGEPFEFYLDKFFEVRSTAICQRVFTIASGGRLLPNICIRAGYRYGFANKKSIWFYVSSYNQLQYRFEKLCREIKKIRSPYVIYGFSSYFKELVRLCNEKNVSFRPKGVIISGEELPLEQKKEIEGTFNTNVFTSYGTLEFGLLAHDCEYGNQHFSTDSYYIEILDKDDNPVEDGGEGRVIITSFDNLIMPFIRYDTGDIGLIYKESCDCARTSPCIKIVGRQSNIITLSTGRKVPFLDLLTTFRANEDIIKQFQVIEKDTDEFIIKIIPEKEINENRLLNIKNSLHRILDYSIKISFEMVDEIQSTPSGKKINFKSLVKNK